MTTYKFSLLHYHVKDGIAEITLDNPPANVINPQMTDEYFQALDIANNDSEVRIILLSGKGKGLSGGVDLKLLDTYGPSEMKAFLARFYVEMIDKVRSLNKPIMAAVHGYAMEGACTLAFACDMIIASSDAKFGYPGVPNLAAPPGMHVWHLQRLIGRMKAAELIYTGKTISAVDADRLGMITRVVPPEDLMSASRELAQEVAAMSPVGLKAARELIYRMENMDFKTVPGTALDAVALAFASDDSKEARRAFVEKRKPVWTGK
ncbi:enoyl-CoA hydratase/isomerase family protein [Sneathiella marina]|uniref:Enoyl-CoA hydratase/isomerase family protein n=1 Tax=Sneathiella marina TaxID=2950108 RepID=A0ABY4W4U5_9PROT|nr:enoyl-CoA hydratase/isomerase family protein [Sneathiella marina]USG60917.1 enoyl-CoA hydratase/isomerase family protein [Sneathiella marina]